MCKAIALVTVLLVASVASAEPIIDTFQGEYRFGLVSGGGMGYNGGAWYEYPSGWWNQWFLDGHLDPARWKLINCHVVIENVTMPAPFVVFAINWSNSLWDTGGLTPPLPPNGDAYIVRDIFWEGPVNGPMAIDGQVIIPDYNPEWVSIDIRSGTPPEGSFNFGGEIRHECIPEPATLSLLALGGLALLRRRRQA